MKTILYIISLPLMIFASGPEVVGPELMIETASMDQDGKSLSLSIVQLDGSSVTLTDGSSYTIQLEDRVKSSGWIGNASEVDVQDTKDGSAYPLIITNKVTGTSVRAVLVGPESGSSGS